MSQAVNGRRYHSPRRAEQAAATRHAVLTSARRLFTEQGYAATTVAAVAAGAQVAVDTVYAAVGRKPELLREVVETAISGTDLAVPAEQRRYVQRIHEAPTAAGKVAVYAQAIGTVLVRLGPVYLALRDAAATDPDCRELWADISARRATNMRAFVADLRATGELDTPWSDDELADLVWSMNAPEYWALLVHERGWSTDRLTAWLTAAWTSMLGVAPAPPQSAGTEEG